MGHNVLYYTESDDTSDAWEQRLSEHGYDVYRTADQDQLILYAKFRPTIGVLLETSLAEDAPPPITDLIRRLRDEPAMTSIPIVAILPGMDALDSVQSMAEAGLAGFYVRGMPEDLLLYYLAAGRSILSLKKLEDSGMTVQKLANDTRHKMHDLSQPLAALQGRLQILQTKTPADNPQKDRIDLMVKLAMEVSGHLRDIQELHRQYE